MTTFLVVKVVDVLKAPVAGALVQASFDGAANATLNAVGSGIYETRVPDAAARIRVFVAQDGFWDVTQLLTVDRSSEPATLAYDGERHVNVLVATVCTRGSDYNAEIHIVLGQLRDAEAVVRGFARSHSSIQIGLQPEEIRTHGDPILNPDGTGPSIVNMSRTVITPSPLARVLFAERLTVPRLIGIVDPGWSQSIPDLEFHYHVFYPPPPGWPEEEPFWWRDADFISRYLVRRRELGGKLLAYQNLGTEPRSVLVFPVTTRTNRTGDVATQAGMLRLLQEVNFWLQRMQGISYPRHPLGRAALSCFSEGANAVSQILRGPRDPQFYDHVLQAVIVLDGVVRGHNGYPNFCAALDRWHRRGAGNRSYRIYSQYSWWWEAIAGSAGGPGYLPHASLVSPTPRHTREAEDPVRTALWISAAVWPDPNEANRIHHAIPARFMEHAARHTTYQR